MTISFVVAMGRNKVIGSNNSLPWNMPADMKHFKKLTLGKPIIMGRKTYETIGKPLPNRKNIIITRDQDYKAEGCIVAHSIEESLQSAENAEEVMVIGGAQIYKEFLPKANRIYLTIIDHDFEGDTHFPEYNEEEWQEIEREEHKADEENKYDYVFVTLERK
ncbi:type 3 dihydrofolate reductase [Candidatus Woesearchaeota archaeon]|nr:type 3 dihydrofolate reductase [Candidatus Woesearchaeota archaeon]|tara:strand:- start:1697 stop:2182 length:486 start_codon:yes stop_codon:yes gene_type:complete